MVEGGLQDRVGPGQVGEEEEDEKEERPKSDHELGMFNKKLEKYFFEKRAVYL